MSGHAECWALYAERLMVELGYLDSPADRLGALDQLSLRAARVVLDMGVHCDLPAPASVGGGRWDYGKAWQFLSAHSRMSEGVLRYELDRYLGWPGQAPSHKIGERRRLRLRDQTRYRWRPDQRTAATEPLRRADGPAGCHSPAGRARPGQPDADAEIAPHICARPARVAALIGHRRTR